MSALRQIVLAAVTGLLTALAIFGASSAGAAQPQDVTINHCVNGPNNTGVWSASGALSDTGTSALLSRVVTGYSDVTGMGSNIVQPTIEFDSTAGSFVLTNNLHFFATSDPGVVDMAGTWFISSGTGAYAGLQGQGQNTGRADSTTFCVTYTGQVHLVGR